MKRTFVRLCRALAAALAAVVFMGSAAYAHGLDSPPVSTIKTGMDDNAVIGGVYKSERISEMASACSAALIEANSGIVLLESNPDLRLPMASTTKTMTALITLENCALDELVKIPQEACGVEGSSMYLQANEEVTVRDLLYGLMLASGNDAAVALAVHIAGSTEKFADMMNARAAEMGLKNTHFVTPNGLHANEHYTTAYELALIGAQAIKNPDFTKIVSTQYYSAKSGNHVRTFKNKNALLWDYAGALGIKTGYTMAAGRCLLFAAEKDGMVLVGAVLNCKPMFEVASSMLDYGFDNYTLQTIIKAGTELAKGIVANGEKSILDLNAKEDIIIPVKNGETVRFTVKVEAYTPFSAPVSQNAALGRIEIYSDDELIAQTELVASEEVAKRGLGYYLRLLSLLFAS